MRSLLVALFMCSSGILMAECALDECGPHPGMPNYLCSDGINMAGPGDCIQNDAGQCYWEIITCPSTSGYLRTIETSFCMDECSQYSIETEIDPGFGTINIIPADFILDDIDLYIDRFVVVNLGHEVTCVECTAFGIEEISLSDDCQYAVDCFQDPCEVAEECQFNTTVECIANYCGGCYADFYVLNGNLVDCYDDSSCSGTNPAGCFQNNCLDGYECIDDWENSCVPSYCSCDEITGQWMCTDDCNGGSCIEEDISEGCGVFSSCDDCTDFGCFWQPADGGICIEECMIADIDCYGSTSSWIAECPGDIICTDLSDLFFGWCDMYLGVGYSDDFCQHISGCGWDVDGIDYSNAFFEYIDECEEACGGGDMTCDEIADTYDSLHGDQHATCEFDNDCMAVWGHCNVGLGGCHYSVNEEYYPEEEINDLVNMWLNEDCMEWVCDCAAEPYAQCVDETCTSAYCMSDNPAGCFQAGCDEAYECIIDPNECVASWCGCDDFYGDWLCTEDCGGGSCVASGDVNVDGLITVHDIIIIVNFIMGISEPDIDAFILSDINNDSILTVHDIVQLVNIIMS